MKKRRKEPQRDQTDANLLWPPTKEDLERLYVKERLSAMKISKLYGLRYPNPKSGEAMILHYLKKWGIKRRDPAEHSRKATKEVVDEWVRRYEAGESLKDIANDAKVSPVTVFNHLRKRGVKLRDKVEMVIKANTIHPKKPFSGDPLERAYLLGFARGDLWITIHGRAVRVKGGSTHPAFVNLFQELFGRYGPIYLYPKEAKLTEYEWSMDADLDGSFKFLLHRNDKELLSIMTERHLFLSYLAGFFDAEGTVYYHKKGSGGAFELSIANSEIALLELLKEQLETYGYGCKISKSRQDQKGRVVRGQPHIWRLHIWRHDDATKLLRDLPIRHGEKTAKKQVALDLPAWPSKIERTEVLGRWVALSDRIKKEVQEFIQQARQVAQARDLSVR